MTHSNDGSKPPEQTPEAFPGNSLRPSRGGGVPAIVVPIRSLGVNHRGRIASHLLSLEPQDRYLRFGFGASDEHVQRYVDGLDLARDEVFGIYNRTLKLIAMAHLAFPAKMTELTTAEFGVSVLKSARGRGYGARLFERACMHARNDGITHMVIHALSENTAMLRIARTAGAVVTRDGPESEARLRLPQATLDTRITEIVQEQLAQFDYHFKQRAHHFRKVLTLLQADKATTTSPPPSRDA